MNKNPIDNFGEQLLPEVTLNKSFEEIEKERALEDEAQREATLERLNNANALYGNRQRGFDDIQKEFEKMQKEAESSEAEEIDTNDEFGAKISSVTELINSPFEPIQYVWDKFFPRGELCVIYGDSSCGKSTNIRCLAFAIAYGMKEYLGFDIGLEDDERRVGLAITEDNERNTKSLLQKQNVFFEPFRTIENPVFDVISCCENGVVDTLNKLMPTKKYNVIFIDTPQDDILGSMNDNNVVREYLNKLSLIAAKYDCAIICIHHKRKYTLDKAPSKEDLSGTRAFCDKPRAVVEMRWHVDEPNAVWLTPIKANYESQEFLKESYLLRMDTETLTFTHNGEKALSNTIHMSVHKKDMTEDIKEKIVQYRHENPTIRQTEIAELLREDFPDRKINQSQVSKIIKQLKDKE
jgi:RecA-family ATPase